MERARTPAVVFLLVFLFAALPNHASADTLIGTDISEDTTWTKVGSPYLAPAAGVTVGPDATLSIEPGVVVRFDSGGGLLVSGRLAAAGTAEEPILFTSLANIGWGGIEFSNPEEASSLAHVVIRYANTGITDFYSKDLSLSHIRVEDGDYGIDAAGSHLSLNNFSAENMSNEALDVRDGSIVTLSALVLKNVGASVQIYSDSIADISDILIDGASGEALAVYIGSQVSVASSTIRNVSDSAGAVEVFVDSSLDISGLILDGVSGGDALSVFDNSTMTVRDSSISNTDNSEVVFAYDAGSLILTRVKIVGGSEDGVAIYGGGSLDMHDSVISGLENGAGVVVYGRSDDPRSSVSLSKNEIIGNNVGIELYSDNSVYAISNNSIHNNATNGLESYGTSAIDVSNNYWGDLSGPYNDPNNLSGTGNGIYRKASAGMVTFSPWLTSDPLDPCAEPGACASNVLFLPGIEGSRLYEGIGCGGTSEEKLWEPIGESLLKILRGAGDDKVRKLFLDPSGASVCAGIYVKPGDVIDSVRGNNIYQSFIDEMNELEADGTINDWGPVAYDWRLSLDDLLAKGAERDGKIYYTEATSTPYIEQTLRALAASSKTGKVSIVAHSNGGLLAKALLDKLGSSTSTTLVDKVIMVGAPQSGAPVDIGSTLFGYDAGIYKFNFPVVSNAVARSFLQNSPMAYHLLPSQIYFDSVMEDAAHPVARFAGDGYAKELSAYGAAIGTETELTDFLLAKEGGREEPAISDVSSAEILNASLIDYANSTHTSLDSWTPPAGIEVNQIAGWGVDTVAGIDFYTLDRNAGALSAATPVRMYRPIFVEDGDGIVPIPSALMMATSTNVKRYWLDLFSYNGETHSSRKHKDLFEIPQLEDFIKNIIKNSTSTLPTYISSTQPPTNTENKKLTFFLHSPLTLQLTDSSGNVTGLAEDGSIDQDIPDSTYGEFGEVKYITVPQGSTYELTMHGQASGSFSLDIQESSGSVVTASSTIANVPTTEHTLASLTVSGGLDTASPLAVDENGDGAAEISLTPRAGETVIYEPAAPTPPPARSTSQAGRGRSGPSVLPVSSISPIAPIPTTPMPLENPPVVVATAGVTAAKSQKPATVMRRAQKSQVVTLPNLSQTASVFDASQQPVLKKLGVVVYNGLHGLWAALKRFF